MNSNVEFERQERRYHFGRFGEQIVSFYNYLYGPKNCHILPNLSWKPRYLTRSDVERTTLATNELDMN